MQRAIEQAFVELSASVGSLARSSVVELLLRHGVPEADAQAIAEAGVERVAVYRQLVQRTHRRAIELQIPRSVARLESLWDEYFLKFLSERGSLSHYLRDVTGEFIAWVEPLLKRDLRAPRYLHDLMRHEALRVEIGALPAASTVGADGELQLDRGVRFIAASRIVRYRFAVHRLPEDESDRSEPARIHSALFVYRSADHDVRYLQLSPLAAAIVQRLHEEQLPLGAAIRQACDALGQGVDDSVLSGVVSVLADLAERGALLGPQLSNPGERRLD